MSYVSEFWADVKDKRLEIQAALTQPEHRLQPKDGSVFIISIQNRQQNTLAGKMSIAGVALAGQRLAEGSHRLATAEEIQTYLDEQKAVKARMVKMEIARRQTIQMEVAP